MPAVVEKPKPVPLTDAQQHEVVRLVRLLALQMHPQNASEYDEFVSAGLVGAAKGLRKYDPAKGALSTYLTLPICKAIGDHIEANAYQRRACSLEQITESRNEYREQRGWRPERVEKDIEGRFAYQDEPPSDTYLYGLPRKTRAVIRLLFWEGLSRKQIGQRLGMRLATVSMHKTYGLRIIRDRLEGRVGVW